MNKQPIKIPMLSDYIGKEYELVKDATVHHTFLPKGTQFKIKKISGIQVTVSILKGPFEENILDAIENDRAMNFEQNIFDLQASIDIWEREPEKFRCIVQGVFEHIDGKLGYYSYQKDKNNWYSLERYREILSRDMEFLSDLKNHDEKFRNKFRKSLRAGYVVLTSELNKWKFIRV